MFLLILSLIAVCLLIFGLWAEPSITLKPFKIDMSFTQIARGLGGFFFVAGLVLINITTRQMAYKEGVVDMSEKAVEVLQEEVAKSYQEGLVKGAEVATDEVITKLKDAAKDKVTKDKSTDDLIDWE